MLTKVREESVEPGVCKRCNLNIRPRRRYCDNCADIARARKILEQMHESVRTGKWNHATLTAGISDAYMLLRDPQVSTAARIWSVEKPAEK